MQTTFTMEWVPNHDAPDPQQVATKVIEDPSQTMPSHTHLVRASGSPPLLHTYAKWHLLSFKHLCHGDQCFIILSYSFMIVIYVPPHSP